MFFFNDTATTEIYTLSLHDALPICASSPTALASTPSSSASASNSRCSQLSASRVQVAQSAALVFPTLLGSAVPQHSGTFLILVRNPERRSRIDAWLVRFGLQAGHTLGQCQDQLCHVCLSYDRLRLCRWHGRTYSKNLGGPVKGFLLPLRYDC